MTASLLAVFVGLCSRASLAQIGQGSCEINDFNEVSLLQGSISHDAEPLILGEAADVPLLMSSQEERGNNWTWLHILRSARRESRNTSQPDSQQFVLHEGGGSHVSTSEHLVAWLHIPKCGTSFGTTLVHYLNSSLPPSATLPDMKNLDWINYQIGGSYSPPKAFTVRYPIDTWFKGLLWEKEDKGDGPNWGGHAEITADVYEKWRGHLFGMFRSPAKRMHSAWNHIVPHKCDLATFFEQQKGLATKLVAGQDGGWARKNGGWSMQGNWSARMALVPDLQLALERLDGFKFIGLTDYWNTSICLFHAMFGGQVTQQELENIRPGQYSQPSQSQQEEESFFNSHVDPYDSGLYEKASAIFWANVKQYKVNDSECTRTE